MGMQILHMAVFYDKFRPIDVERFEFCNRLAVKQRHSEQKVVGFAVFHNPGSAVPPTATIFTGFGMYGLRSTVNDLVPGAAGIDVRAINFITPGREEASRSFFRWSGSAFMNIPFTNPAAAALGGMDAALISIDHDDPRFLDLQNRMFAKVNEILANPLLFSEGLPDHFGDY